ncbi:MAG: hypothetical protein CBE08_002275 [Euryarchaeota archaeon TMED248]|nr:MAG: hypothetical protein CBE08_002275 [Euryarchaeota archaeon TMED248]
MRCQFLVALLLCMIISPVALGQTEGRAPPSCSESNVADISNSLSLDANLCWKMNLGTLQPGDVYEVEVNIINDAIDVLFFDQSTIQSYDLGQSYRSQLDSKSSIENASGGYNFHWKVPASINPKTWYIVLDNLAHDGDQGFGDQGGATSQISLDFIKLQDSYWTPYHDVLSVPAQSYQTLLSGDDLKLDSGTTIVLTAWELEGVGDVYLQTKQMHDLYVSGGVGQLYITTTEMQSITTSDSTTWVVPNELEGEELVLIVDNTDNPVGGGDGSQDVRITVRVQLAPPIDPQISVANLGITSIGVGLDLDSMATPNLLDQIETLSWDFDDSVDVDGDGIFDNDADQEGWQAVGVWNSPGQKVVTLTASSKDSQIAKTNRTITVQDTVPPTAIISSSGQVISGGWKTDLNEEIPFSCSDSTDDDEVVLCSWTLDGEFYDENSTIALSWSNIGNHVLVLTVADPAGNSNSISKNIVVNDDSDPVLDQSKLELLADSGVEGTPLKFSASAIDSYDQSYQLTYHWDLDPNVDSDGNGNNNDDPNFVGSEVEIIFEQTGRVDVVLTVIDQSGNTDSHPFSVNVAAESEPTSIFAFVIVILFIGVITMAVSMIGYRRWQGNIALELLTGRGLSQAEAKAHIRMVNQKMKVPIFASASVIAGLDTNQPVESSQEKEERAKQVRYDSIYGSKQQDPNAGFAPQNNTFQPIVRQVSQGSQTAAADALAMFAEDETETIIESRTNQQPEKVVETKVNSGGIELPQNIKTRISTPVKEPVEEPIQEPNKVIDDTRSITCPECNHQFSIKIPQGVEQAVVACPSCNIDFGIEFA